VVHDLASVTVVDSSAMEADAMATALLVLGPDKGMRLANERRIAAFFMIRDGDRILTRHSQAFEPYLTNGSSR
jgi:thiamine biosynthesis lipoprotein